MKHFFCHEKKNDVSETESTNDRALNTAHIGDDVKCESIEGLYEKYGRYAENYSPNNFHRKMSLICKLIGKDASKKIFKPLIPQAV